MAKPPQPTVPLPCRVETYSGARLHDHPRRFNFQGEWLTVGRILKRWREPEFLGFLVVTSDSQSYCLKYHFQEDAWQVVIWPGSGPAAV